VDDVHDKGDIIKAKDAEKFRKNFLKENIESKYRDAANAFIEHSEMKIATFMTTVVGFTTNSKKDFAKNEETFSMQRILPCPMELMSTKLHTYANGTQGEENDRLRKEMKEKHGSENSNDWHCDNWGCKWEVDAEYQEIGGGAVMYTFDSAWSPPTRFIENICDQYPLVRFFLEYSEPGNDFEGELEAEGGVVTLNVEREYSGNEEDDENEGMEWDEETQDWIEKKEDNE